MKTVYVAMSGGVDSSVAAALLQEQGYSVVGVFMKFWSPGASTHLGGVGTPFTSEESGYCIWKQEREDAMRVAAKLGIPLLTWDFTHEYETNVVEYMLEAYKAGFTPNPDIMCNKYIKFGMFFDKAMAEGADYVATGHYCRIRGISNFQFPISNQVPNSNNQTSQTVIPAEAGILPIGEKDPGSRASGWDDIEEGASGQDDIVVVRNNSTIQQFNNLELLKGLDPNKDQSYFLYTLEQRHLEKTLFPIGGLLKSEVRELAKKFDLPTAEKKDSQGICFIGPVKMREFLKEYIKPRKGPVVLKSKVKEGDILGRHDGVFYYTIGQRHGIDLGLAGGPYYVIEKDVENNIIYVGSEEDLYSSEAIVSNIHWIGETPTLPADILVKIRYRAEDVAAKLQCPISNFQFPKNGQRLNTKYQILFNKPVRAIAPGQAAVFYDGDKVLGGGTFIGKQH